MPRMPTARRLSVRNRPPLRPQMSTDHLHVKGCQYSNFPGPTVADDSDSSPSEEKKSGLMYYLSLVAHFGSTSCMHVAFKLLKVSDVN